MNRRRVRWGLLLLSGLTVRSVGWAQEGAAGLPGGENLAAGKTVTFGTPPNNDSAMDPDDVRQLTDGKLSPATPMWYDKSCVGWTLVDSTVFTIDLAEVRPIRGVGLHMGAGQAGVEWPTSLRLLVSDDGQRYSDVGNLMEGLVRPPPAQGYASFWLATDRLQTHGRFVRFVATPVNLGNGAYIMLDEVEVYRGEAAWLDRPLVWPEAPTRWRADWSQLQWTSQTGSTPYSERPTRVALVDGDATTGAEVPLQQAVSGPAGTAFTLHGEAGRPRSMSWTAPLARPPFGHDRKPIGRQGGDSVPQGRHPYRVIHVGGASSQRASNENVRDGALSGCAVGPRTRWLTMASVWGG